MMNLNVVFAQFAICFLEIESTDIAMTAFQPNTFGFGSLASVNLICRCYVRCAFIIPVVFIFIT